MTKIQRENRKKRKTRKGIQVRVNSFSTSQSVIFSSRTSLFYRTNVSASAHKSCILRNCCKNTKITTIEYVLENSEILTVSSQLSSARSSFNMRVVSNPALLFFRVSTTSEQTLNILCFWWWSLWYNWAKREHFEQTPKFWKIGKIRQIATFISKILQNQVNLTSYFHTAQFENFCQLKIRQIEESDI